MFSLFFNYLIFLHWSVQVLHPLGNSVSSWISFYFVANSVMKICLFFPHRIYLHPYLEYTGIYIIS